MNYSFTFLPHIGIFTCVFSFKHNVFLTASSFVNTDDDVTLAMVISLDADGIGQPF